MSESEGSLTLRKTNFKEGNLFNLYIQNWIDSFLLDQGKEKLKVQNEIELLEVYV